MKKYRYRGDGPVDLDALGLVEVTPNTVVEVPSELTDGFDGREDFEHVPDPKRQRAGKKAAATRDENEGDN